MTYMKIHKCLIGNKNFLFAFEHTSRVQGHKMHPSMDGRGALLLFTCKWVKEKKKLQYFFMLGKA
jgi:hypothetical protein